MIVIYILLFVVGFCLFWRTFNRYYFIPWPYWLEFWLHNPYMQWFASPSQTIDQMEIDISSEHEDYSFLEVGCGGGRILMSLIHRFKESQFFGVDAQPKMIDIARVRLNKLGSLTKSSQLIAREYKVEMFGENQFDHIALITVLGELQDQGKVLKACLLYTSPSPRDATLSRMPSSA